jgi:hypothetical protein
MSKTFTVVLTDAENLALSYAAVSPEAWIDNAAHERARIATEEIVAIAVKKYLDNNISIPATREEIVQDAFDRGWVTAAAA